MAASRGFTGARWLRHRCLHPVSRLPANPYARPRSGSERAQFRGRPSEWEETCMRHLVVSLLSAGAAIAIGASAHAQQPAPAPSGPPPYGESINLDQSMKIVEAAVAEAKKNNWFMAITVV